MLNTIQDIERYNVVNRLERNAPVGSNTVHLRATPAALVGVTLTFEPNTARQESHVVNAVSEHLVTLATTLAYLHELDTPVVRTDLIGLAQNGDYYLGSSTSVGATSALVNYVPEWVKVGSYIVIDVFTIDCEIRKITNISGNTLQFSALAYAHASGDPILYKDTDEANARWFAALGDDSTDDLPALQRCFAAAKVTDSKEMYIPAGSYRIGATFTNGHMFNTAGVTGLKVRGAGMGKTILKFVDNWIPAGNVTVWRLSGKYNFIEDMTITAGPGMNNTHEERWVGVIAINEHSSTVYGKYCEVKRIEISHLVGMYLPGGGTGIGTYSSWWEHEVDTTLTSEVAAPGSATVSVANCDGITRGMRLFMGWASETSNVEEVVVTETSEDTFTATFTTTHAIGTRVVAYNQSKQHCLIEDCYVHDMVQFTAFGAGSNDNRFVRCKAVRGDGGSTEHGFYNTGGYNVFDSCYVEGWSGYHYHNYKQTPRRDTAGDMFVNCTSLNPRHQHMIHQGIPNNVASPYNTDFPVDNSLLRYTIVKGCIFRNSNGHRCEGLKSSFPIIVEGCVFDDLYGTGGAAIVDISDAWAQSRRSVIANNIFRFTNQPIGVTNFNIIRLSSGCSVVGNVVDAIEADLFVGYILTSDYCVIANNVLYNAGISVSGTDVTVNGNKIDNAKTNAPIYIYSTARNIMFVNNTNHSPSASALFNDLSAVTGVIENNDFGGAAIRNSGAGMSTGLLFRNNRGCSIYSGASINEASGASSGLVATGGAITMRRLVKVAGAGAIDVGTADTDFIGVGANTATAGNGALVMCDPGAVVEIDTDGTWVAGNYGIVSPTAAGKVNDQGAGIPASGSYVRFLNAGTGAGVATCRLIKTV